MILDHDAEEIPAEWASRLACDGYVQAKSDQVADFFKGETDRMVVNPIVSLWTVGGTHKAQALGLDTVKRLPTVIPPMIWRAASRFAADPPWLFSLCVEWYDLRGGDQGIVAMTIDLVNADIAGTVVTCLVNEDDERVVFGRPQAMRRCDGGVFESFKRVLQARTS